MISKYWTLWTPIFRPFLTHTDWLQYWYAQLDRKTVRFTTVVCPTPLWQPNWQTASILVLTSQQKLDMFIIKLNYLFEMILSLRIPYDKSINQNNVLMRTIHHVKQIAIILVFLCSPLNFCLFVLYSNSIHKQCDNNPPVPSQINYSCTRLNNPITNSGIIILNPLNANIPALLHTYWQGTVLVHTRWFRKPVYLPQWFILIHYGNQINKHLIFWCSPITKDLICFQCDSILCLKLFFV